MLFLGLLYGLFLITIVIREIIYIKRERDIRLISAVRMMFALIYGFIPCSTFLSYDISGVITQGIDYSSSGLIKSSFLLILSILAYFLINFGYMTKVGNNSHYLNYNGSYEEENNQNVGAVLSVIIICSIIAIISLFLWTKAYGGASEMMKYAASIRSGFTIRENSLAFFKHFVNVSTVGAYLSFGLLIDKNNSISMKINGLILLIINSYCKLMYSLIDDGRMTAAIFVVGFAIIYLYYGFVQDRISTRKMIILMGLMLFVGYLLIIFSEGFMNLFRYGSFAMELSTFDISSSLRREMSYTIASGQKALELRWEGYEYTFFKNLFSGLFAYLPSSLTPDFANTSLTQINSANLYGTLVQYGSPPDFLTVALYDLGLVGVVIYPILFGRILKRIDGLFEYKKYHSMYSLIIYICLMFRLARIIPNGSFYNIALSLFYLFIAAIIVRIVNGIRIFK